MLSKIIQQEFQNNNITHCFLTKNIKNSTHKYVCKSNSDNLDDIKNNHHIATEVFFNKKVQINVLKQVHGNDVVVIESDIDMSKPIEGDAIVTNTKNLVIGVMTADCVPVLLADSENKVIAAVHCGWRSAFADIIANTKEKMCSLGAKNIKAAIGPCIRQHNYEVDQGFYNKFLDNDIKNKMFFTTSSKDEHYLFDLPSFVKNKLQLSGINDIFDCNLDTYDDEMFFSFRRQKQQHLGSIISLITIN